MLLEEFRNLPWDEQLVLIKLWKLDKTNDVLSLAVLQHRLSFVDWGISTLLTDVKMNYASLYQVEIPIELCYFNTICLIVSCFDTYETFFLLSSSKGRVGKKSVLARLPNELFYCVIKLFLLK